MRSGGVRGSSSSGDGLRWPVAATTSAVCAPAALLSYAPHVLLTHGMLVAQAVAPEQQLLRRCCQRRW